MVRQAEMGDWVVGYDPSRRLEWRAGFLPWINQGGSVMARLCLRTLDAPVCPMDTTEEPASLGGSSAIDEQPGQCVAPVAGSTYRRRRGSRRARRRQARGLANPPHFAP